MRSVIGDVILGVAVILIITVGMLFLDRGDLRMADALDLMAVGKVRMMRGGDVIVGVVGRRGLDVLVGGQLEVVSGLAVVIGGVVVELVLALGNHRSWLPLRVQAAGAVGTGGVTRSVPLATACLGTSLKVVPDCVRASWVDARWWLRTRTACRCSYAAVSGRRDWLRLSGTVWVQEA